nr:DUF202 domain-containing protein [uncultured Albidiferax sp.]
MSYLDDPRVFFAAERTLLAWQRSAVALLGLGFVVERFGLFVRLVSVGSKQVVDMSPPSIYVAIFFLVVSSAISILSAIQYGRIMREMAEPEVPRGHLVWLGPGVNFLLAGVSLALAGWFVSSVAR